MRKEKELSFASVTVNHVIRDVDFFKILYDEPY